MATNYFNLPTVDPDSTLSFPDAVNGLAIATDDVLQSVQDSFGSIDVTDLPVASTKELGVVRVGDGFRVFADGTLSTTAAPFKLRPATDKVLGGVYIGTNVEVVDDGSENDGSISIGFGAFNTTEVTSNELANGGVQTSDFKNLTVDSTKLDGAVVNDVSKVENLFSSTDGYRLAKTSVYLNPITSFILCYKIAENFWVFAKPFYETPSIFGTATTNQPMGLVAGRGTTSVEIPEMAPAELFADDVTLTAYGYAYTNNKWQICRVATATIHGATAKYDVRHTIINSTPPTHYYLPPTIVQTRA